VLQMANLTNAALAKLVAAGVVLVPFDSSNLDQALLSPGLEEQRQEAMSCQMHCQGTDTTIDLHSLSRMHRRSMGIMIDSRSPFSNDSRKLVLICC